MAAGDYSVQNDGGKWNACKKTRTYDGTTNKGATGASTLFTVTGMVRVKLYARCTTNMAGATATNELGTAISSTGLIALTTMTNLVANENWNDASPDASVEADTVAPIKVVNQDIIETVRTAAITAGVIEYNLLWQPVSADGNVVAA